MILLGRISKRRVNNSTVLPSAVAALILISTLGDQLWQMAELRAAVSLPLHLCDLAGLLAAYGVLTSARWAVVTVMYWTLLATGQSFITPTVIYDFPHGKFLTYWFQHVAPLWGVCYSVFGTGIRPDWKSYQINVVLTTLWMVTAALINYALGTNYGMLRRPPRDAWTMLDVLGPWPTYIGVVLGMYFAASALITFLFEERQSAEN